jgi:hypothetical protein
VYFGTPKFKTKHSLNQFGPYLREDPLGWAEGEKLATWLGSSLVPQNFCQMHESQKGAAAHQNADTTSFCILVSSCQEFCKKLSIE